MTYTIGGHDKKLISLGQALSYAQHLAAQTREPIQYGIYQDGEQIGRVERHPDNVVTTNLFTTNGHG